MLAAFRFLAVSILSFLLLSPLIKSIQREVEKPVVIFAHDNSESMALTKDSGFLKNNFQKDYQDLINSVSGKYEVKTLSYGDHISDEINFSYTDKQSDLSQLFKEIQDRYEGRNIGAVVLSGDGILNKGSNPLYVSSFLKCPVYTIALGDTTVKRDLAIQTVNHNRIAYLGNNFPVEIIINAKQAERKKFNVSIMQGAQKIFNQDIIAEGSNIVKTLQTQILAKQAGLQRYKVIISQIEGETSYKNNVLDFFIDVLDAREKILIVANSPHPDIAAIRQAIEANDNYEVKMMLGELPTEKLEEYNLVIFHQLPSTSGNIRNMVEELNKKNISILYIIGNQTAISTFNTLNAGINISNAKSSSNDAEPVLDKNFSLFTVSDNTRRLINDLPPLMAPFGNYQLSNAAYPFLNQQIGSVETKYPLIAFNQLQDNKTGIICGEGLWKWRLADYQMKNNHEGFNEIISKIVQYLSVKTDKSLFRVSNKSNFNENESVVIDAELYNQTYELINDPEVRVDIYNSENKKYPFTFSKTSNSYRLNAGELPVGEYHYEASVKTNNKVLTDKGQFTISALQIEEANITADHQLLHALSKKHEGLLYYPSQLKQLTEVLLNNDKIKSISYSHKKLSDFIHLKWIFFLLLTLLSIEWFIRKRNGGY